MAIKIPKYKVIKKYSGFKLREYNNFIIAKAEINAKKHTYIKVMVIRFSGFVNECILKKKRNELQT